MGAGAKGCQRQNALLVPWDLCELLGRQALCFSEFLLSADDPEEMNVADTASGSAFAASFGCFLHSKSCRECGLSSNIR